MTNPFSDPPASANPYAAPKTPELAEHRANPLFVPGLLMVLGSLFWSLYLVMAIAIMLAPSGPLQGEELAFVRVTTGVSYVVMIITSLIAGFGAVAMMRLKWKGLAWTGCILGLLPVFGPCFGLTIPIAIWVLVLLRRPEVDARFS